MFGSNNPESQFWEQSLSNESPSFQCICPLPNRAVNTCLSHYTHVCPQKVLNNTLAEQTIDSWTHKPFALVQARHFSARGWANELRDHITQGLLLVALGVSQLQSTGGTETQRALPSFPTCLHSSSSTAWDWPPPSRKLSWFSSLLHLPQSTPRHMKKPNRAKRFAAVFEPSNQSPEVSLENSCTKSLSSLVMAHARLLQAWGALLWNQQHFCYKQIQWSS